MGAQISQKKAWNSRPCHPTGGLGDRTRKEKLIRDGLETGLYVRNGYFRRASDGREIGRFRCKKCHRSFSWATTSSCFAQKKRQLNAAIEKLLVSGVSQRRIARLLSVNRKTVVNKFLFLWREARREIKNEHHAILKSGTLVQNIHFDEMESFEHTKCKPLSIPLVVEAKTRKILGCKVCEMPAKGHLAAISRKKYGLRRDDREEAALYLFRKIRPILAKNLTVTSDKKSTYPGWIRRGLWQGVGHAPGARLNQERTSDVSSKQFSVKHITVKGARGCVTGQGELKALFYDPLFDLNHTAAMFRANVNRLFRRTWNTTKIPARLEAHMILYIRYHNEHLTKPRNETLSLAA